MKPCLRFVSDNLRLIVCKQMLSLRMSFCFFNYFKRFLFSSNFCKGLDIFRFDFFAIESFIGMNFLNLLFSFHFNTGLDEVDFFNINFVIDCHEFLEVVSLLLKHFLILIIIQNQHSILLLFHLFLEVHIIIGSMHEKLSQVSWENDVHDCN